MVVTTFKPLLSSNFHPLKRSEKHNNIESESVLWLFLPIKESRIFCVAIEANQKIIHNKTRARDHDEKQTCHQTYSLSMGIWNDNRSMHSYRSYVNYTLGILTSLFASIDDGEYDSPCKVYVSKYSPIYNEK